MSRYLSSFILALVFFGLCAHVAVASVLLDKAKADYQDQLDKYRYEYQAFDIKRSQYQNVRTFAAQEEMAIAAKVVLLRRVGVWRAYLQMLRVELIEAKGISPELQDSLVRRLEDWQIVLDSHSERVNPLETRDLLLQEALFLNSQNTSISLDTFVALANVKLAQVQAVLDTQTALNDALAEAVRVQIRDNIARESRLRGLEQVDQIHTLAQADLSALSDQIKDLETSGYNPDSKYEDLIAELTPIYQDLRQSFALMQELSKGLQ